MDDSQWWVYLGMEKEYWDRGYTIFLKIFFVDIYIDIHLGSEQLFLIPKSVLFITPGLLTPNIHHSFSVFYNLLFIILLSPLRLYGQVSNVPLAECCHEAETRVRLTPLVSRQLY